MLFEQIGCKQELALHAHCTHNTHIHTYIINRSPNASIYCQCGHCWCYCLNVLFSASAHFLCLSFSVTNTHSGFLPHFICFVRWFIDVALGFVTSLLVSFVPTKFHHQIKCNRSLCTTGVKYIPYIYMWTNISVFIMHNIVMVVMPMPMPQL